MTTAAQKSLATSTTGTACADSDSTEFVHDEQYWFDDGNVVIVAQKIGFRIYQGHLSSVSSLTLQTSRPEQPQSNAPSSSASHVADLKRRKLSSR